MTKSDKALQAAVLGFFGIAIALYFIFPNFTTGAGPSDIIYLLASFLPMAGAFYALKLYGSGSNGRSLTLIALSFTALFIGETLWLGFEQVGMDPFPSIADLFYIASYPLLFFGLLIQLKQAKVEWSNQGGFSKVLIWLSLITLIIFVGYFGIYFAYDGESTLLENVVGMSYGVGDLILIFLSLFVLKMTEEFRGGQLFNAWLAVFIGLFLTLLADIGFAIYNEAYELGQFAYNATLDFLWIGSFLAFAYGFFSMGNIIKKVQSRVLKK